MTDYTKIEKEVDAVADVIWDVGSNVWEFAELGMEEVQSSPYAAAALEKVGFKISDRGIGGLDTSWIATWGSGSPTIGILLEFDALPGLGNDTKPTQTPAPSGNTNGHGCGHNLICSTSVGAAIAVKNHMEKENIPGTIKVLGCPAEEKMTGKNYMAQAGAFKGLDVALHNHPLSVNSVWNFHSTAMADMIIEWRGVSAHAAAAPWLGRSAVHAMEVFLVAANMMREQMKPTARLHYQILDGGYAVNSIPDYARVLVRYRGDKAENVTECRNWLEDMAKGNGDLTQRVKLASGYELGQVATAFHVKYHIGAGVAGYDVLGKDHEQYIGTYYASAAGHNREPVAIAIEGDTQLITVLFVLCARQYHRCGETLTQRLTHVFCVAGQEQVGTNGLHISKTTFTIGKNSPFDVQAMVFDTVENAKPGIGAIARNQDHFNALVVGFIGVQCQQLFDQLKGLTGLQVFILPADLIFGVGFQALGLEYRMAFIQVEQRTRRYCHDKPYGFQFGDIDRGGLHW